MSERTQREQLHNITPEALRFEVQIQQQMAQDAVQGIGIDRYYDPEGAAALLSDYGIDTTVVLPEAAPEPFRLQKLTPEDWELVGTAAEPYKTLWSRANLRNWEAQQQSYSQTPRRRANLAEECRFRALPLVHGTSFAALQSATEHGTFLSNRALYEEGVDVTDGIGATNATDRELGLDGYIFADFGRPHNQRMQGGQPEVMVLLDPIALAEDPQAFVTDNDVQDVQGGRPLSLRQYAEGLHTAEDFYAYGANRVLNARSTRVVPGNNVGAQINPPLGLDEYARGSDGDPSSMGGATFTPWEVKLGQTGTQHISRIIFRDAEQHQAFVDAHGDVFDAVYDPSFSDTLASNPYDALKTQERFVEHYTHAIEADYAWREEVIASLPPDQVEEVYDTVEPWALRVPSGVDAQALELKIDLGNTGYASAEEAVSRAQYQYDEWIRDGVPPEENPSHIIITKKLRGGGVSVTTTIEPHKLQTDRTR